MTRRRQIVNLFLTSYLFACLGFSLVRADIKCYMCTSTFLDPNGQPIEGKKNVNCPVEGSVNPNVTYFESCKNKCLIRTNSRSNGVVIRSCSDLIPLPQPLPESGCFSHRKDIHCLCNTSYCNGQAMNNLLKNRTLQDLKSLARAASEEFEKINKENPGHRRFACDNGEIKLYLTLKAASVNIKTFDRTHRQSRSLAVIYCVLGSDINKDAPHQCYICQSSYKGTINENCPGNDHINAGPTIYRSNCSGLCYVKTDVRYEGIVFRGCTDSVYAFPTPTPKDGCYKYYLEVWCICRGRLCNTKPLGTAQNKELDYLMVGKNKSPRHLTTLSFIIMAAGATILSTEPTSIDGE